jgi:hypothetical protein
MRWITKNTRLSSFVLSQRSVRSSRSLSTDLMRGSNRECPRVPFGAGGTVYSNGYQREGTIANLSLGGCFFATGTPLGTGELLHISFYSTSMALRGTGVVRHVQPKSGMGVEFTAVTREFRAAISFLVGSL